MGMTTTGLDGSMPTPTTDPVYAIQPDRFVPSTDDARVVNDDENPLQHHYSSLVKDLGHKMDMVLSTLEPTREVAIARTKVEEAVMWAVKGIMK